MIPVVFNNTDLSGLTNVLIDHVNKDSWPTRIVNTQKLARADGRAYIDSSFDLREIIVRGRIVAADQNTFEQNRSSLMQYLTPRNANLDLIIGTSLIRFYATVSELIFSDTAGGFGVFTAKFTCRDPIGINPNLTAALAPTVITAATSTQALTAITGNYQVLPIIDLYINSISGGTSKTVTITNTATSKSIEITRTWVAGERLVINVANKTVKVNNVEVPYVGDLLTWDVGAGNIKYDDTFTTSRNVTLKMEYNKRYL